MVWKTIKFLLKWSLIAFGIYFGFWLVLALLIPLIIAKGVLSGLETASGPSPRQYYREWR